VASRPSDAPADSTKFEQAKTMNPSYSVPAGSAPPAGSQDADTAATSGLRRRALLAGAAQAGAAWALVGPVQAQAPAQTADAGPQPARIALLIGNRDYPEQQDLPSMHTNVRRTQAALESVGFRCTTAFDLDREATLQAVQQFAAQWRDLPPGAVGLFYFCGHGMQIASENFLLPARLYPRERRLEDSRRLNVELGKDVRAQLPATESRLMISIIDACRTTPTRTGTDDGLNQVKANPGELVVFSTGAGKPALAPINPDRMTFFTDALVNRLQALATRPDEIGFADFFRSVGLEVTRTMRNHPAVAIQRLAQEPFIADNTSAPVRVSMLRAPAQPQQPAGQLPGAAVEADVSSRDRGETEAYERIRGALWPRDVQRWSMEFLQRYPGSRYQASVEVAEAGAAQGATVINALDVALERESFALRPELGERFNEDLRRASRGDKDAAARVGERLGQTRRTEDLLQFEGWMQFAAALGNGIAAFDLARYYSATNRSAEVGRWVSRAVQLGYNPPPGLRGTR